MTAARIAGSMVLGSPGLFGVVEPYDLSGTVVKHREHPDYDGHEYGDQPLYEPVNLPVKILLQRHAAADFRTSVWDASGTLVWQTIPCDDLRLAVYIAACVTVGFRIAR